MISRALLLVTCFTLYPSIVVAQVETGPLNKKTGSDTSYDGGSPQVITGDKASAPVGAAAPDLVRLKDGGMLRGTISELVANDHVTMVTVAGETRSLKMSEVEYAGQAAQAPATPAATAIALTTPQTPRKPASHEGAGRKPPVDGAHEAPTARLRFSANYPNLTLYLNTGRVRGDFTGYVNGYWHRPGELMFGEINSNYYTRLCTAPCTTSVPEGRYTLALGLDDDVVAAENKLDLKGDVDLKGEYVDRSGWRTAGVVVFGGAVLGGLILMMVDRSAGGAIWITGAGVALAGGIAGGIMLSQRDQAYISASR